MKDSKNRDKNLEWFKQLDLSDQLDIFQDIAAMSRIIANNPMQENLTNMCGEKYSREKLLPRISYYIKNKLKII